MGKHIKTRSAEQCRSHYQKFEVKFTEITDMLENMVDEVLKISKNSK